MYIYIYIRIGYLLLTHFDMACNPVLYFSNYQCTLTFSRYSIGYISTILDFVFDVWKKNVP